LLHQILPQRPEELWMMVREVSLDRLEQLIASLADELRPALAFGDSPVSVRDRGHLALILVVQLGLWVRPAENICVGDPGVHCGRQVPTWTLSIRFQIVAGCCTR
jgi:hypothetical protein